MSLNCWARIAFLLLASWLVPMGWGWLICLTRWNNSITLLGVRTSSVFKISNFLHFQNRIFCLNKKFWTSGWLILRSLLCQFKRHIIFFNEILVIVNLLLILDFIFHVYFYHLRLTVIVFKHSLSSFLRIQISSIQCLIAIFCK